MNPLSTTYLGLELKSPLITSASPMALEAANLKQMQSHGAGAIVLPSLFEHRRCGALQDASEYIRRIRQAKGELEVPIIASLSAMTPNAWPELAEEIAGAGADALELNIHHPKLHPTMTSAAIEDYYESTVMRVKAACAIPVAVKLSPFFTNLSALARSLHTAGAAGLVLFTRFYSADIDLATKGPATDLRLSTSSDQLITLRWLALLHKQGVGELSASGGIHTGEDALKAIVSGATTAQLCSVLLEHGIPWIRVVEQQLRDWMQRCEFRSIEEARGTLSRTFVREPAEIEEEEYGKALAAFQRVDVPTWQEEVPLPAANFTS